MRKKKIPTLAIIFSVVIGLSGCVEDGIRRPEGSCVGVVETSGNSDDSRIYILNEGLFDKGELPLKYASVTNPRVFGKELYAIPQGYFESRNETIVLSVNLYSLRIRTYDIGLPGMQKVYADDDYIYACTIDTVAIYSKANKTVVTRKLDGKEISDIVCINTNIYVLGIDKNDAKNMEKPRIWTLNREMEVIREKDISEYGIIPQKVIEHAGKIYFANTFDVNGEPCGKVLVYSIAEDKIDSIALEQNYLSDMEFYNETLVISHFNGSDSFFGGITFYNTETSEVKSFKLDHGAEDIQIKGDKIYILNRKGMYSYKIEYSGLKRAITDDRSPMDSNHYFSGFFVFND
ncbi:MAG: hypothetical protein E7241_07785 [Lachnospiraceae bacterium]|jgi:hypothetical protein|nr:hypothetical protein [Lachnospiraceae bacterium]